MQKNSDFTNGKIMKPLLKFSLPILLALLLQAMYGAVDLMVVGRYGDSSGVSAVATGSQIMQAITGIVSGMTMGTTVLIGQKIGEGKKESAARAMGTSVCMFGVMAVILSVVISIFSVQLAQFMHAPQAAFEQTVDYVRICAAGTVFIVAYNVISGIFRGIGDSRLPLIFVAIACVVNILGDLVLVAGFKMGAAGAAIATDAAQAVSVIISLVIIKHRELPFEFHKKHIRFHKTELLRIIKLGSPIALQDALTSVSFLIITAIVNSLGLIASAAVGVSEKLVIFIMLVPIAYMSSISAFAAQNIGAAKPDRAIKAMKYGMLTSLVFGAVMFVVAFFFGEYMTGIFSTDVQVVTAGAEYMKAYAIDCIMVSVLFCFMGFFNGCGKTVFVMIQGAAAALLIRVPYSYFMSKSTGVTMFKLGLASPIATFLSIILCTVYFIYVVDKMKKDSKIKQKRD